MLTQSRGTRCHVVAWIIVLSALAVAIPRLTLAQPVTGTPGATPETEADCTANLGIIRSATVCVAVVHAVPGAPAVDVFVDGYLTVEALAFGEATEFLTQVAGMTEVVVAPTGDGVDAALLTEPVDFVIAQAYELAVIPDGDAVALLTTDVDVSALPEPNVPEIPNTRVRVAHVVPDAAPVTASLIADDIAERLAENVAFGDVSAYAVRSAGTYMLNVELSDDSGIFTEVELPAGQVSTIYIVSGPSGGTPTVVVVSTSVSRLPDLNGTPSA